MMPRAEHVHWLFAGGFVLLGLCVLAEAVVGPDVWARRAWRPYLWPSLVFVIGVLLWPVMTFFTNSAIHMIAHGAWAQTMMFCGAAELGLVRGKLRSGWWRLAMPCALAVSGVAFLVHEQNDWLFSRAAFLHHALGWTLIASALFPLGQTLRPRAFVWRAGFAMSWVTIAVLLYCDRDVAPIFGHLSPLAGAPR